MASQMLPTLTVTLSESWALADLGAPWAKHPARWWPARWLALGSSGSVTEVWLPCPGLPLTSCVQRSS